MYPEKLEIDGMKEGGDENVIVRVSVWVYSESLSERADTHLHSPQTDSGGAHHTKPTTPTMLLCMRRLVSSSDEQG